MEEYIDYETYKYLSQQAEAYVPFSDLLKFHGVTFQEAQKNVSAFKEQFQSLLAKYAIGHNNIVQCCYDLMNRIEQSPDNMNLQYLYLCLVTDCGLLSCTDFTDGIDVQAVENYFQQIDKMQDLSDFLAVQIENSQKLKCLKAYLKKPITARNPDITEELDLLYHLTSQHTFLYECRNNHIYKDNLNALLMCINSDEKLQSVKPYVIFAVLSRKHGMMQNRENYLPNIRSVFEYQNYNISCDNGKNFNTYQSNIELYDHLRRTYIDDKNIDMGLSDFCFANLSPLSEWYYANCEPNEEIPMNIRNKVLSVMPVSFPMLLSSYEAYNELNDDELHLYADAEYKLKEQMLDTSLNFIKNNRQ